MLSYHEMTPAELRHTLQTMATSFARAAFLRLNPRAGEAAASTWAAHNWQQFELRAVDCLALMEAQREMTEAN